MHACHSSTYGGSEDNLQKSVLVFYNVDSGDQTQALSLDRTPLAIDPSHRPLLFTLFGVLLCSAMHQMGHMTAASWSIFATVSDTCSLMGWI